MVRNGSGQFRDGTLKLYLKNEQMEESHFLNVGANLGGHGQKWLWPFRL